MKTVSSIILAAGLGKRMHSALPKVMHHLCGMPMLFYPLRVIKRIGIKRIVLVVGHRGETVREAFKKEKGIVFVEQKQQLGTGHAVLCAEKEIRDSIDDVLIISGDVPLIKEETIRGLIRFHQRKGTPLSFITTVIGNPAGYGRVIRGANGSVVKVVEERDATRKEKEVNEVNTGIYIIRSDFLFSNLTKIQKNNAQGEYYLPDLISLAIEEGKQVAAITHIQPLEVMGVNTRIELSLAQKLMKERINRSLMMKGVTIIDPESTYIDYGVKIGQDAVIYPNVILQGKISIGSGCIIEEGCRISDSSLGRDVSIKSHTYIEKSKIGNHAAIGPFARLRPGNLIKEGVRIGNFVEVKNSSVGKGSKAGHLSYIGDADIGSGVNIGAGAITCNYDGRKKHRTTIMDDVFIGSDTQLIAPVRVGKGAYIGSGSTITRDVPPGSLALSRVEQKNIEGWAERMRKDK